MKKTRTADEIFEQYERNRETRRRAWTPERRARQSERLTQAEVQWRMLDGRIAAHVRRLVGGLANRSLPIEFVEEMASRLGEELSRNLGYREELAQHCAECRGVSLPEFDKLIMSMSTHLLTLNNAIGTARSNDVIGR